MLSPCVPPLRRVRHLARYSAAEWRHLLKLLSQLEGLSTAQARSRWIERLRCKDGEAATALLQLVAAREGAEASRFMSSPVIQRGELRRHVDALLAVSSHLPD